ncbi:hypothetical protein CVT25_015435 [Psilocybe cyanescens]|uniref:F-box domain-containing protein n=1 Tax=Psilocybe cyanescens TaxID=93625 RepID=A0A409WHI2_PSICY|nr:hypothetical protein CVT25_015435 [Psilocybe cyanescens]
MYRDKRTEIDYHPVLPVELMRPIIQNLVGDISTLYALTLTCWTTHSDAEKLLYRCMNRYNWRTQIDFFRKITDRPHYALLVEVIYVLPRPFQWDPDELQKTLTLALRHTVNLKEFRDGCFEDSLRPLLEPELPIFRLESFFFHHASGIGQFNVLFQFLLSQPGLLRLSIELEPNIIIFRQIMDSLNLCSARIAPKLQFLRGNLAMIVLFLRGRNITALDWEPTSLFEDGKSYLDPIFSFHVEPHLGHLKYLCLRRYAYSRQRLPLKHIVQHLHNLEYIDLPDFQVRFCTPMPSRSLNSQPLSQPIETRALEFIPSLRGLAITGISTPNTTQPDFSHTALVKVVFSECSHIELVVIEVRSSYQMLGGREFQIWRRHNLYDSDYELPPIILVSIFELAMHNIFELLPI